MGIRDLKFVKSCGVKPKNILSECHMDNGYVMKAKNQRSGQWLAFWAGLKPASAESWFLSKFFIILPWVNIYQGKLKYMAYSTMKLGSTFKHYLNNN